MDTKNDMMFYESPQVEILEVEIEKGFAVSLPNEDTNEGVLEEYM